ncbi:MAG: N-acetyltransferase [bacterium]|nr:N-acetyltransferase [bacterium]MCP4967499.1 N-acetyltransferase [bacterium]
MTFVPDDFAVPQSFDGPGFQLEPLGALHNERDYEAWTTSFDHIKATPGFVGGNWPHEMSLEDNLSDLVGHATDFEARTGFTYSILDGADVIGCVYIYPSRKESYDAAVSSWVVRDRAEMDAVTWRSLSDWLATSWPFTNVKYAPRRTPSR